MSSNSLRVAFDTSIFFWPRETRERLREKVRAGDIIAILPVIAYAERVRQIADRPGVNWATSVFRQFVADLGLTIASFTESHAETVADVWLSLEVNNRNSEFWQANKTDVFIIAMSKTEGWILVTDDKGIQFDALATMNREEFSGAFLK